MNYFDTSLLAYPYDPPLRFSSTEMIVMMNEVFS